MHLPRLSTAAILAGLTAASTGCVTRTVYVVDDRPSTRVAAAPAAVVEAPPMPAPDNAPAYEEESGISDPYDFVQPLSPYGQWVQYPGYGLVFVPASGVVGANFRPYTNGHWEHTEWGWTWVDHHPFGWATGHYGRWFYDGSYGWVWVPGTQWAPAWVSWRTGGGYIGWSAMPPGSVYGGAYTVYDTSWVFVQTGNFGVTYVGGVIVTGSAYRSCYTSTYPSRSTVVVYGRNTYRGPDYDEVSRETRVIHRPIRETERERPVTRPPAGTVVSGRDRGRDTGGLDGRDRDGRDGRPGRDGTDGRDGRDGNTGSGRDRDGNNGNNGRDGNNGNNGRDGNNGNNDRGNNGNNGSGRGRDRDDNGHGNDPGGVDPSNPGNSDGVGGGRDGNNGSGRDDAGNNGNNGSGRDDAGNNGNNGNGRDDAGNSGNGRDDAGNNGNSGNGRDDSNGNTGNGRDDNGNNGNNGNERGQGRGNDTGRANASGSGSPVPVTVPGRPTDIRETTPRGTRELPPSRTNFDDPARVPSTRPELARPERPTVSPSRPVPERPSMSPSRPTPSRPTPSRPNTPPRPTPPSRIEAQPSRPAPQPAQSAPAPSSSSSTTKKPDSKKATPAKSTPAKSKSSSRKR